MGCENEAFVEPVRALKNQPQYSVLAETLIREINAGTYPVGSHLPPEMTLCERFAMSRNTVRSAVRVLSDMGLVSRHRGIGTIVQARSATPRYVHEVASLSDLFPRIELTEQTVLRTSDVVADVPLAQVLACEPGQSWVCFETMRHSRKERLPVAYSQIYVPPAFRAIGPRLSKLSQPSHEALEKMFGVQVAEVIQQTDAQILPANIAKVLHLPARSAGLHVIRRFIDGSGRVMMVTDNRYPAGQASYLTRLRLNWRPPAA